MDGAGRLGCLAGFMHSFIAFNAHGDKRSLNRLPAALLPLRAVVEGALCTPPTQHAAPRNAMANDWVSALTGLVGRGRAAGDADDQRPLGQPVGGLHQLAVRQLVGHLRGREGGARGTAKWMDDGEGVSASSPRQLVGDPQG